LGYRSSLDAVAKNKSLALLGTEPQFLGHPARTPMLYWLLGHRETNLNYVTADEYGTTHYETFITHLAHLSLPALRTTIGSAFLGSLKLFETNTLRMLPATAARAAHFGFVRVFVGSTYAL
jgi:hypothetical protein